MSRSGTPGYARLRKRGLTLAQQSTVDLLAGGKNDTQAADLLKLSRTTVTKWRLYDPEFQAALNRRRAEVWGAAADRLRALVPKALDVLADELEKPDGQHRLKASAEILRLAQVPAGGLGIGATEAEAIVRQVVLARRQAAPDLLEELLDKGKGLPPLDSQIEETWRELEALADGPAEGDEPPEALKEAGGPSKPAGAVLAADSKREQQGRRQDRPG